MFYYTLCTHTEQIRCHLNFQLVSELGTLWLDLFLECNPFDFYSFFFVMSQNLNIVPAFDGTNYGYWEAHMRFFLKPIDCWQIVESGWTKLDDTTLELVPTRNA
jgi:hypothetical protein